MEWRRHIHENPELPFQEDKTGDYVAKVLKSFKNIEVIRPAKTSIVGVLKGANPGKTVAFRADMDALPVQEETGLPYASKVPNVSHACGHDSHTAMLLGTAKVLSEMQKDINGTVYFVFQHAEEQDPGGALDIINSGVLDNVEAFFGMHVLPNMPVGHIGILPNGAASTTSDGFELTINGKGSHGSMPHLGTDPIVIGSQIVNALQSVVARNVVPGDLAVISVGKFHSGNANNVIADKAELGATVRTVSQPTRELVKERVETLVENIAEAHNATYDLNYFSSYPAIQNDVQLNAMAKASAEKAVGATHVFEAERMTASEDFSYYKKIAPTAFLVLGVGDGVANHNPKFNLDEAALKYGVTTQVQIILDYLNSDNNPQLIN
ncbi:amidohydrolase [Flavobacterium agricola]|uniref:Amidohydrolase n=1 Tax=Flavobacterium agricola TaxID=2870839 RepID=A0ABY6M4N1_9FLAO|nr:amidohydrolase [Flavobacterium agricola]UYW02638.1 amidohydrolase [Flavobacterium agricola]